MTPMPDNELRAIAEAARKAKLEAWVNYEPIECNDRQMTMGAHLRHAFMSGYDAGLAAFQARTALERTGA